MSPIEILNRGTNSASTKDHPIRYARFDQLPKSIRGGSLSVETLTGDQTNAAVGALGNTPFSAVHPDVAGGRNAIRAADEESITLGPAQEIRPRQHANDRTLLRAKKK